jgi:hypothetical protein
MILVCLIVLVLVATYYVGYDAGVRSSYSQSISTVKTMMIPRTTVNVSTNTNHYYIFGAIHNCGSFSLDRPGLTLRDAIAAAGGLTEWADKNNVKIEHFDRTVLKLTVQDVAGNGEKYKIQPMDTIVVGERGIYWSRFP